MTLLVVGLSHASAPVTTLERAVVSGDSQTKLLHDVNSSAGIKGALVLSTCNRVEIYADVLSFHGGVAAICDRLALHSGLTQSELVGSAYVHYQDRAAQHLMAVACGLESLVIGESQILGQVRQAVKLARQHGTLSREMSDLSRLALRAGKRAHSETGIDAAGQNLVSLGVSLSAARLEAQAARLPAAEPATDPEQESAARPVAEPPLDAFSLLIVGAGAMSSLAVATVTRLGAARVLVANRTRASAERLAEKYGAEVIGLSELQDGIAASDLVITCTGAAGHVITAPAIASALDGRPAGRPLVLLDLALPRDVEPAVAELPGVHVVDMTVIAESGDADGSVALASETDIVAVRRIVAAELSSFRKADRAASVAPTVVALRAKAANVVEAELARLERRLGDLDPKTRQEIAQSMGRIADKLLHGPTVRVKELAGTPGADSYESALRVLFELDPEAVQAVGRPDEDMLAWPTGEGES
ncbi:MAG TPA: glutamyl-tRNA reductase [Streptosporangiaceae bacterium]|nr:glutamyl-tRNA reductase [Streptosporangiaceae bacterium]